MTLRVWGEAYQTADATGTGKSLLFIYEKDCLLKAVKPSIIIYGDPAFTAISAAIHADNAGSPGALLATSSNTQTKAAITTLANAFKQVWFDFLPTVALEAYAPYHVVLNLSGGYTYSESSHVAWAKDFPQPINPLGQTPLMTKLGINPFACEFFTAEFY
jgi:hypothetical protein